MQHTVEKPLITYNLASELIKASMDHAKKLDIAISAAITDTVGNLVAFAKMDDCCLIGIGLAQGKAYTAARSGLNTTAFKNYLEQEKVCMQSLAQEHLVVIQGGLPIFYQGKLIGGIGVAGSTGADDEQCAQAALTAHNL